mmetsp:Transcript_59202/g.95755  ORF Transcript_59202/g.95755 Transcript_59202/m.95755 type:complete len:92 (-) Transcript_59202:1127-1402(-)
MTGGMGVGAAAITGGMGVAFGAAAEATEVTGVFFVLRKKKNQMAKTSAATPTKQPARMPMTIPMPVLSSAEPGASLESDGDPSTRLETIRV